MVSWELVLFSEIDILDSKKLNVLPLPFMITLLSVIIYENLFQSIIIVIIYGNHVLSIVTVLSSMVTVLCVVRNCRA